VTGEESNMNRIIEYEVATAERDVKELTQYVNQLVKIEGWQHGGLNE
jgi:hypothetical protein